MQACRQRRALQGQGMHPVRSLAPWRPGKMHMLMSPAWIGIVAQPLFEVLT